MKLFLILGGLFLIIFTCIIPLKRTIQEYDVQKHGELVTVTITYVPNCLGTKVHYFMAFNYSGQKFDKRIGCGSTDDYKIGEAIKLKHIEGTDIFLFEKETKEGDIVSAGLLGIFGIVFIIIGLRKK